MARDAPRPASARKRDADHVAAVVAAVALSVGRGARGGDDGEAEGESGERDEGSA
jgi:hypothetical protein